MAEPKTIDEIKSLPVWAEWIERVTRLGIWSDVLSLPVWAEWIESSAKSGDMVLSQCLCLCGQSGLKVDSNYKPLLERKSLPVWAEWIERRQDVLIHKIVLSLPVWAEWIERSHMSYMMGLTDVSACVGRVD